MLRQRIKQWGILKNRKDKEMKAVLRIIRLARQDDNAVPKIALRGKIISESEVWAFFRKKTKSGQTLDDLPTPTEAEAEGVTGLRVFNEPSDIDGFDATTSEDVPLLTPPRSEALSQKGLDIKAATLWNTFGKGINQNFRQEMSKPPCKDDVSYSGHPRALLSLWTNVMTNTRATDWYKYMAMRDIVSAGLGILLKRQHPCLILYLILTRRLMRICPRRNDDQCSCVLWNSCASRRAWRIFSNVFFDTRSFKESRPERKILLQALVLDKWSRVWDLYGNARASLIEAKGISAEHNTCLDNDEREVDRVVHGTYLHMYDQHAYYLSQLHSSSWWPNLLGPDILASVLPVFMNGNECEVRTEFEQSLGLGRLLAAWDEQTFMVG